MSRNPYQPASPDWFGCYKGQTSKDRLLFPPGLEKPKRKKDGQRKLLGKGLRYAEERADSTCHPAKMALPLLRRILATMRGWGWLADGATLVDPFGGRGSTGVVWCAQHPDNRAVTIELEPPFVEIQRQVKAHAEKRLGRPLHWTILQGDSRRADELLAGVLDAGVMSAPYEQSLASGNPDAKGGLFRDPKRRSDPGLTGTYGAVMSAPYAGCEGAIHRSKFKDPEAFAAEQARRRAAGETRSHGASAGALLQAMGKVPASYGDTPGQIGNLPDPVVITSSPYGQGTIGKTKVERMRALTQDPASSLHGRNPDGPWFQALANGYHSSPGQIADLPDPVAAVTSAPYSQSEVMHIGRSIGEAWRVNGQAAIPAEQGNKRTRRYGFTEGQIGQLPDEPPAAALTSAPYEDSVNQGEGANDTHARGQRKEAAGVDMSRAANVGGPNSVLNREQVYGHQEAQIGATAGETYASACGQVYAACARAGIRYLVSVTKNPTRSGRLRRLDKLTARLLRQAGYRVVAWRRAWLFMGQSEVDRLAGQASLFGDELRSEKLVGRLSFFRRLQIARGGVAAQWEDVVFAVLEEPPGGRADG